MARSEYIVRTVKSCPDALDVALRSRLYRDGWMLQGTMERMRERGQENVVVAFHQKEPVGVCVRTDFNQLMAYVKPSHRRKGIASRMVKKLRTRRCYAGIGIYGSRYFWNRNKIKIEEW